MSSLSWAYNEWLLSKDPTTGISSCPAQKVRSLFAINYADPIGFILGFIGDGVRHAYNNVPFAL